MKTSQHPVARTMTKQDAVAILNTNHWGTYEEHEGPYSVAGYHIWEIWDDDGDDGDVNYNIRFVTRDASGDERYYGNCQSFCTFLEAQHRRDVRTGLFDLVAAVVFVAVAGALLLIVVRLDLSSQAKVVWATFTTLVGAGGAYFFGRRRRK